MDSDRPAFARPAQPGPFVSRGAQAGEGREDLTLLESKQLPVPF